MRDLKNNKILLQILLHIGLGFLAFVFRPSMMVYFFLISGYFLYRIFSRNDKQQQILIAAAYMMGAEVFFRMTKAFIFYETGKYMVILFMIIGLYYQGINKKSYAYLVYMLLLLVGVLIAVGNLEYQINFRTQVMFNLSGPLCLTFSALYCYGKKVSLKDFQEILDAMIYPLITMTVFIFLFTPDIKEVITGTASTAATSGGYGPNQVATMLGLGVFVLFSRLLIPYKNRMAHLIMMLFMLIMAYRALVTFSRGGVYVSVGMILVFLLVLYFTTSIKTKFKISIKLMLVMIAVLAIWIYASSQTGGLIENRYANKDALGREKEDITTGRGNLISTELEAFEENPWFGLGVGNGKYYRMQEIGVESASHNEFSRMLSEHGLFGIFALLILILAPIIDKLYGRNNIYFLPFILFWFLTINHSAMRIAAPAFIYGLSLLTLHYAKTKTAIHRE